VKSKGIEARTLRALYEAEEQQRSEFKKIRGMKGVVDEMSARGSFVKKERFHDHLSLSLTLS